jgi:hypothetical protein
MDLALTVMFHFSTIRRRCALFQAPRVSNGLLRLYMYRAELTPLFCCRFYHDLYVIGFVFVELTKIDERVVCVVVTYV